MTGDEIGDQSPARSQSHPHAAAERKIVPELQIVIEEAGSMVMPTITGRLGGSSARWSSGAARRGRERNRQTRPVSPSAMGHVGVAFVAAEVVRPPRHVPSSRHQGGWAPRAHPPRPQTVRGTPSRESRPLLQDGNRTHFLALRSRDANVIPADATRRCDASEPFHATDDCRWCGSRPARSGWTPAGRRSRS
jgi:hypothetical protein